MTATPRHVIFGTGAIGPAVLDALRRRGQTARLVNRSGHARVVHRTPNPPYPEWTAEVPLLQAGVPAAAETTGARLVRFPVALTGGTAPCSATPANRTPTPASPTSVRTRRHAAAVPP